MSRRLIALDLDGTLLDSRKRVPAESAALIREVLAAGVAVAFDTGRGLPELREVQRLLPEVRYAVYASGAAVYDAREDRVFSLRDIPRELTDRVMALGEGRDLMPQLVLRDRIVIQASHMADLGRYHMEIYRPLYEKAMTLVPDIYAFARSLREPVLKINLYHADPPERLRTRDALAGLALERTLAEVSSLELSAKGVHKGSGLLRLCGELGLSPADCVAVGDADNDIPMLSAAGLGVAMGNAPAHVRAAADRTVRDQDHGGCADALRMCLPGAP